MCVSLYVIGQGERLQITMRLIMSRGALTIQKRDGYVRCRRGKMDVVCVE